MRNPLSALIALLCYLGFVASVLKILSDNESSALFLVIAAFSFAGMVLAMRTYFRRERAA